VSTNEIRVSEEALDTLAEVLDDIITIATVSKRKVEPFDIARETLDVLAQFGWELVCRAPVGSVIENQEPLERNMFEAFADRAREEAKNV
jgi:hypothetical protein